MLGMCFVGWYCVWEMVPLLSHSLVFVYIWGRD